MILNALYELATLEGLTSDPDFQPVGVSWVVRVTTDGRIAAVDDHRSHVPGKHGKTARYSARPMKVPLQRGRSGTKAPPAFLVDNAKYVFGIPTADKDFSAAEGQEKSGWFRGELKLCLSATADEGVAAVLKALEGWAAGERPVLLPLEVRSNDQFAFVYEPDVDRCVHDRPAVVAYWRAKRRKEAETLTSDDGTSTRMNCIVTGAPLVTASLFPKVKVPGGQSAGASLVSFNARAFESYGLTSSENAPMSGDAAQAAGTALRRLVEPAFPSPTDPSVAMPRRNIRVGDDMLVCFWSSRSTPLLEVFGSVMDNIDPEQVGERYRSIWYGRPAPITDDSAFYILTLSGAQGRIVVRDWVATTGDRVNEHLARHFGDLTIVRNTPVPKGRSLTPYLPLSTLLTALAPFGRKSAIPDALSTAVVHAAITGSPYPVSLLQRALERTRAEVGQTEWVDLERRDARAMLIIAVLRRTFHQTTLAPEMDPTNRNPGYLCGRLLAVLERLQQLALDNVNATVVDRFFGAASAAPRTVFVRLLRNAQHHTRKAMDDPARAGLAVVLKRTIDELADGFDPKNNGFPAFLTLEDQGLFVLGYHQQRHALWRRRPDSASDDDTSAAS